MPVEHVAKLITQGTRLVFFVGAGISTSAGIPDFRSPDTGLYNNLAKLNLPYAEAVFDIDFFKKNPQPFYTLAKELYPGQFTPTKFHLFMALLHRKDLLHRIYTQNIDTLERIAGVPPDLIIEAHGCFDDHRCVKCHKQYDGALFKEKLFKDELIKCDACKGYVKPSIVFFGEGLPQRFFECWEDDTAEYNETYEPDGDAKFVALIAGTSLKVHPFASLPEELPVFIPRVLINQELVGTFEDDPRHDDQIYLGQTDAFVQDLCEELGWEKELEQLRLEVEMSAREVSRDEEEEIKEDIKLEMKEKKETKKTEVEDNNKDEPEKKVYSKSKSQDLTDKIADLTIEPNGDHAYSR